MIKKKQTDSMAIASFVLGLISIIFGWVPIIGLGMVLLAFIFGIVSLKRISHKNYLEGRGLAIAGIVLSSVILCAYFLILMIFGLAFMKGFFGGTVERLKEIEKHVDSSEFNLPNIMRETKFESDENFCRNTKNYNFEKITLTPYPVIYGQNLGKTFSQSDYAPNKWYPSLKEGYIGMYLFAFNNEGCTKIDKSKIRLSYYLYHNNKLIFQQKKTNMHLNWYIMEDYIYPQTREFIRRGIFYDPITEFVMPDLFKITDDGEYIIKINLYYKGEGIGTLWDSIIIE